MAIPEGITGSFSGASVTMETVPVKKFTLGALSDTDGLTDPDTSEPVTARAIRTNVAGTLALQDPFGNQTAEIVEAGEIVLGLCNGVLSTGTVTITASDLTVYL